MKKLIKLFKNWQGLSLFFVASLIWMISPFIIHAWDKTAGCFDGGVLQIPLFALICFTFAIFLVWTIIQIEFPTIDKWLDKGGFGKDWDKLSPSERIKYVLYIFFAFLMAFIILCRVI